MVSEKKIFISFSHYKSMGANDFFIVLGFNDMSTLVGHSEETEEIKTFPLYLLQE